MRMVSWPGYGPQVLGVVTVLSGLLWRLELREEALLCALAGLASLLSNNLLKLIIARPRPSADLVDVITQVTGYSFPSGHVMFYTAFFGFLFFLSYMLLKSSWKRWLLLLLFGGLVVLVGPSRIYLGNHWASDVYAAYLMGSLILAGVITLYNRWSARSRAGGSKTTA
jgi:undecaprenyl-diphosphatase